MIKNNIKIKDICSGSRLISFSTAIIKDLPGWFEGSSVISSASKFPDNFVVSWQKSILKIFLNRLISLASSLLRESFFVVLLKSTYRIMLRSSILRFLEKATRENPDKDIILMPKGFIVVRRYIHIVINNSGILRLAENWLKTLTNYSAWKILLLSFILSAGAGLSRAFYREFSFVRSSLYFAILLTGIISTSQDSACQIIRQNSLFLKAMRSIAGFGAGKIKNIAK
ncbi:MAG: hypothetical protein ABIG46_06975 [Candidatus Omnitrophota bacterium]